MKVCHLREKRMPTTVPDSRGRFGPYGGRYVPETLMYALGQLTEQYEQLRREATSCSEHAAQGLGLALFLRRGMTAWMQAWSQCTDHAAPDTHPRPATPAAVPLDLRTQIATLLAGIILGLQQEATP